MKKRIVAMILTGMMIVTLNGCGTKETDAQETVTETQNQDSSEKATGGAYRTRLRHRLRPEELPGNWCRLP